MKNKYSEDFEEFVRNNISKYTKEDFVNLLNKRYKLNISKNELKCYLRRHNIEGRYIDFKENMVRSTQKHPIGAERMTKDGILIKVAQPNVWRRKSRVMYEKYHNCKLKKDDYIIFLNQDSNDFRKENLKRISKEEFMFLHNCKTFSKNPKLTKLALLSAQLIIKAKRMESE